jgi:tetrapyrrole methylase family protein/MazG family protein
MNERPEGLNAEMEALTGLMERLRAPGGCPWDKEQTLGSLVPFIIEEAYEAAAAIESKRTEDMREELGDLLFQIVFACQIAKEEGRFDMGAVIAGVFEKMVRRHPHVFGDAEAKSSEDVLRKWAEIKEAEKKAGATGGYLSGVPEAMPALLRAKKISERAARAGFDWKGMDEVLAKVEEELDEFMAEARAGDPEGMEDELGDLLFTLVNAARFMEVNPEAALRKTIGKFINRFHHVEKALAAKGEDLTTATMDVMEGLWQEAKAMEAKAPE